MNFLKKFSRYESLLTFLIMELLALTSFALGGNNLIFYIVGFVLAIFGLLVNFKKFERKELVSLAAMGIPVVLIAVFVGFGTLNQSKPVVENIFVFFAIISFFALGLFARRMKSLKIETVLYCIGFGFAMLTLISMIYSWISYGFFYSLIYKDTPNYYYNGAIFDITKESAFLFGFKFKEVTTNYTGLFGIILICFIPGLLYISPKKDKMKFIIVSFIGLVGVLSILSVPNFKALLYLIPVVLVSVLLKFLYGDKMKDETKKKTRKIVYYTFVGLVIFLVIFFVLTFLNSTGVLGFNNVVANSAFLNKIFNNGRLMPINYVLNQSVLEYNLFGFVNSLSYWQTQIAYSAKTFFFEFELVKEGGIFALVVLVFLIVITFASVSRYSSKGKDSPFIKSIIISLMLGIFVYSTFDQDSFPFIHDSETYSSFFRSLPALILLFLMGYTFYPDLKKGEVPAFENEVVEEKKEEKVEDEGEYVDDYTFTVEEEEKTDEK